MTKFTIQAAFLLLFSLAAMTGLMIGCASFGGSLPQEEGLHPRLTPYSYIEEGKILSFAIDTAAARRREESDFIPFTFGVANIGLKKLTLTRESFVLIDDQGKRYPVANLNEARDSPVLTRMDFRMCEHFAGAFAGRWDAWPRAKFVLFPDLSMPTRGTIAERVHLPRYHWVYDILYFPHPEGQLLDRKYEMLLRTEELDHSIVLKFRIR